VRQYPVVLTTVLLLLLGSAWFILYESAESDDYNTELSFDLVRMVAALHHLHNIKVGPARVAGMPPELARDWGQIRFILSRWEAEQDPARREIIKLMKRAVRQEASFDNAYLQQYSGRIVMSDIGTADEKFPLLRAARRVMHDNVLELSAAERSAVAGFVETIFVNELASVKQAHPEAVGRGEPETLAAAYVLRDFMH